jgi:hypothetical protein
MAEAVFKPHDRESVFGLHWIDSDLGDQLNVLECRQAWNQVIELKHKADVITAVLG